MSTTRREFLSQTLTGIVGLTVLQSCSSSSPTAPSPGVDQLVLNLSDSSNSSLNSAGGFVYKPVSGLSLPIIVQRFDNNGTPVFKCAYTQCPHQGLQIDDPSGGQFYCHHHGSRFSDTADSYGTLVNGPAPTGLTTYTCTYDAQANTVTVHFK